MSSVRFTVTKADEDTAEDLEAGDNLQVVEECEKYICDFFSCSCSTFNMLRARP